MFSMRTVSTWYRLSGNCNLLASWWRDERANERFTEAHGATAIRGKRREVIKSRWNLVPCSAHFLSLRFSFTAAVPPHARAALTPKWLGMMFVSWGVHPGCLIAIRDSTLGLLAVREFLIRPFRSQVKCQQAFFLLLALCTFEYFLMRRGLLIWSQFMRRTFCVRR